MMCQCDLRPFYPLLLVVDKPLRNVLQKTWADTAPIFVALDENWKMLSQTYLLYHGYQLGRAGR